MDISWNPYKYADVFIILVGLVFILYFLSKRFTRERMLRFANFEVLEKIYHPGRLQTAFIPMLLRIVALALIILSISDLQLVSEGFVANTDFVLAIDTSSSMLTPDMAPNRLALAKSSSIDWIKKLQQTRIGVVTFAGRAYTQIEPTTDLGQVTKTIEGLGLDQPAGTAIGDALVASSSLLRNAERNKTIILITDGRNNIGVNVSEGLKSLKKEKIKIIAIGIGGNQEAEMTVPAELVGKNATAAEFPGLDEKTLKYLVNETDGKYFQITNAESFKAAFESGVETQKVPTQYNTYLLFAACAVLLLEWAFEITKYRPLP